MNQILFYTLLTFISIHNSFAQLTANAGFDMNVCYSKSVTLGSSPSVSGGTPPYKYFWQPSTFLDSTNIANPIASNITSDVSYTLTVTDYDTTVVYDVININLDKIFTFNAGIDTGYCFGQSVGVSLGASNNNNLYHNFSWAPIASLNNSADPRPVANPSITTIYTLTVSDGICPNNISHVIVTPFLAPFVDAGTDTIIDEGQTISLTGQASAIIWWTPDYNIRYRSSPTPDVWPIITTTYKLSTQNEHGCYSEDYVTVKVANGDKLFFYNAFTPNEDGENDVFYIGNLHKFPNNNLKIFNRYGKQIYSATNYGNTWDGTYLGNLVPTGTYFYVLNDGNGGLYQGSVSILR